MNRSFSQDFVWPDKFGRKENLGHDNRTMLRKEPLVGNFRLQDNSEVNKGVEDREENCRMSTKSKSVTRKSPRTTRTASINEAKKKLALEGELKKLELEMKKQEIQYALKLLKLESEYRQEEVESGAEVEESVEEEGAKQYEQYYDNHKIRQWDRQRSGEVNKPEGEQAKPIKEETTDSSIKMQCDTINEDTEDDQECLEEYQECLEVIHIGVDDDTYSNIIDESLSEDIKEKYTDRQNVNDIFDSKYTEMVQRDPQRDLDQTFTNDEPLPYVNHSGSNVIESKLLKVSHSGLRVNCELKCYDNDLKSNGSDEFFSVDYPRQRKLTENIAKMGLNETDHTEMLTENPIAYTKCLKEYYYYYDIQDCMKAFMDKMGKEEMFDDDIFNNIILPFENRSASNVIDRSFVMITYDPGPVKYRKRKL